MDTPSIPVESLVLGEISNSDDEEAPPKQAATPSPSVPEQQTSRDSCQL